MPDIDPRHIEALAYRMCDYSMDIADRGGIPKNVWGAAQDDAEALLADTPPDVLDAMQDALVRAGRLTEDVEWEEDLDGFGVTIRLQERRRHVTAWSDWKDATDA